MSALPEVKIEIATRRFSSHFRPKRLLSKITRKPIEEIGYWDSKTTEQLSVESYPEFLKKPARGQFPRIEESLEKRGIHIPENWQIQHMLTCLVVGGAKVLNSFPADKDCHPVDFETNEPSVALIIDPYFTKRLGYDIAVHFRVVIVGQEFKGRINTPEYPKWLLEKGIKPELETCVGIPVISTKFGHSERSLSINSFINAEVGNNYATALYDKLIYFTAATIKVSKQRSLFNKITGHLRPSK